MNQQERLNYLVERFTEDSGEYKNLQVGDSEEEKRTVLRSLMNIRMPGSISETVLKIQNEFLTEDAKEKETDMQIETEVFATLPFSDREIISLFGNVLDNALEACERIQDKKRWIKIKIKKKNHLLYIETSNAIKEMPVQNQKEFVSVKEDEILHGYGMKNIQDIVRKYDGIFRYKIYGEYLVCIISIYDIRGAEEE